MRRAVLAAFAIAALGVTTAVAEEGFSPYVEADGTILLPEAYRSWAFLGTWSVVGEDGADGFHVVYTQPETIEAYRRTGLFPDGAVLVKELMATHTDDFTTGRVSYAAETEGWFVMVKDSQGRYPGHPLWGDGWGWALFDAGDPTTTVTENYVDDCLGCHIPAKETDWTYVQAYPVLED